MESYTQFNGNYSNVRTIIKELDHDKLVNSKIIPNIESSILSSDSITATKRYKQFVYKDKNFCFYGMWIDYVVRRGLRFMLKQNFDLGIDPVIDLIQENNYEYIEDLEKYNSNEGKWLDGLYSSYKICTLLYNQDPYTKKDIDSCIPYFQKILKSLIKKWEQNMNYLNGNIYYNKEYTYNNVIGHPDIITDMCVLDIKNSSKFTSMSKQSILQVLSYYCLCRQNKLDVKYVGFVLPMQEEIFLYDVSDWDYRPFLDLLQSETQIPLSLDNNIMNSLTEYLQQICLQESRNTTVNKSLIGSHIKKGANMSTSINNFVKLYSNTPIQMFLSNRNNGKRNKNTESQSIAAGKIIKNNNIVYFTHAPYVINLCANEEWAQRILNEELQLTANMNGKGVVVHVGARVKRTLEESLNNMELMIRSSLSHATEECKLVLETPCGEGTEVCTTMAELQNFFTRFNNEEKKKIGLCIDTCHVFASGIDPFEYISTWNNNSDIPISLIHFNDSIGTFGSRIDRHEKVGEGNIGPFKMNQIAQYCTNLNYPMLTE